jgi:hypothetical protein
MTELEVDPDYNKSVCERVMIDAPPKEEDGVEFDYNRVRNCRLYTEPGQVILTKEFPHDSGLHSHDETRVFIAAEDELLMITRGKLIALTRSVEADAIVMWRIPAANKDGFTISVGELNTFILGERIPWEVKAQVDAVFVDVQDFGEGRFTSGWHLSAEQDPVPEFTREFEAFLQSLPEEEQVKIRRAMEPRKRTGQIAVTKAQYL